MTPKQRHRNIWSALVLVAIAIGIAVWVFVRALLYGITA